MRGLKILNTYLQGSVVVFGAWASWTDDYDEYVADTENKNYCAYEPMMYAFVILIIKWVGILVFKSRIILTFPHS